MECEKVLRIAISAILETTLEMSLIGSLFPIPISSGPKYIGEPPSILIALKNPSFVLREGFSNNKTTFFPFSDSVLNPFLNSKDFSTIFLICFGSKSVIFNKFMIFNPSCSINVY